MKKLFSIITPVHAAKSWLPDFFSDLENQTFQDFEVIISPDDGDDYSEFFSSKVRIVKTNQKNSGAAAARNRAVEIAQGEYFVMLDADDFLSSHYLKSFADYFYKSGERCAVAPTEVFDKSGLISVFGKVDLSYLALKQFTWQLASIHVVCHRSLHIPWVSCGIADDVLRDANLIYGQKQVRVLDSFYRLRVHSDSTCSTIIDERNVQEQYQKIIETSPKEIAEVFVIRKKANLFFEKFRENGEGWYKFYAKNYDLFVQQNL